MAPERVSVHAARLGRPQGLSGQLGGDVVLRTSEDLPRPASLAELALDTVVFAHTSGSMLRKPKYDAELTAMLEEPLGVRRSLQRRRWQQYSGRAARSGWLCLRHTPRK